MKKRKRRRRKYPVPNRKYKDRLFRMIFSNKTDLLALYNAVNGTDYQNPEDLVVNTLEDAVYLSMKNDLSFLSDGTLNLYEHQSSANPNMPCRGFLYLARTYESYIEAEGINLYSGTLKQLPVPIYLVFYNGTKEEPDRTVQKLSDAFMNPKRSKTLTENKSADMYQPCLECTAVMLNINYGHNRELMEKCRRLEEYAIFVDTVRKYKGSGKLTRETVEKAVEECIEQGVLVDILAKQKAEVVGVVLTSFNQEAYDEDLLNEGYQKGHKAGFSEGEESGEKRGVIQGEKRSMELIQRLLSEGRIEDVERITKDEEYRNRLMKEYGIDK